MLPYNNDRRVSRMTGAIMQDDDLIRRIHALTSPLAPLPTAQAPSIEPLAGIRAVLFDIYGTLVISGCGDIGLTAKQATRARTNRDNPFRLALGSAEVDAGTLPDDFDGAAALLEVIGSHHARSRARGIDYPEVDILAVWEELLSELGISADARTTRRIAVEYEFRSNAVWPMPGLSRLIAELKQRGLVLGIVSNAQFYTPLMLAAFLDHDIATSGFDPRCCIWSYRHLVGKPSTQVYGAALAALHQHHDVSPEQVLYVGNDLRNDIWPASRLGCRTALFAGDARSLRLRQDDARLRDLWPNCVLTTLAQVTESLLPVNVHGSSTRIATELPKHPPE
jgi:putative hydrolase of the HAD superfamily